MEEHEAMAIESTTYNRQTTCWRVKAPNII